MANILINGIAAKSGGGKSILTNYLELLKASQSGNKYFVIVPDNKSYKKFISENISIILPGFFSRKTILLPLVYYRSFRKWIRDYDIDLIINFGDIIIPVRTDQIYFFDWAYAIYPESIVWQRMALKEKLIRKTKIFFIKKYINLPKIILAQTSTAKSRLERQYQRRNVRILPNAPSLDHLTGGIIESFGFADDKVKLLCLTKYYTHKNLEILVPLAQKIKDDHLPYQIIITIDRNQHRNAAELLKKIDQLQLQGVITNIGPVEMSKLPSLYAQTDALLMPTLLESFSGTYVEALFHGKTILTSDFDFAHDVCGDAAFYFDPLSVDSIYNSIQSAFISEEIRSKKIVIGKERLESMYSWERVFNELQEIATDVLN